MIAEMNDTTTFEQYRSLLFSIAYRMLGGVAEAEDMVQETFLRWQRQAGEEIQSAKALLTTIITRSCIDHLKSARHQREQYVGVWLPEPPAKPSNDCIVCRRGARRRFIRNANRRPSPGRKPSRRFLKPTFRTRFLRKRGGSFPGRNWPS